jgi:hypothetical protein
MGSAVNSIFFKGIFFNQVDCGDKLQMVMVSNTKQKVQSQTQKGKKKKKENPGTVGCCYHVPSI